MKKKAEITRRDFINGFAMSLAAGTTLSPLELLAMTDDAVAARVASLYPPALTGMRGDHPGSFEVAHALAWQGASWPRPEQQTDNTYDLVVVGGGLSGLGAAFYWQQKNGRDSRVLVIDNHDDFGGHCKRNEFLVDGVPLIGYGGSQSIDTPGHYSQGAAKLLRDTGIDVDRFYTYYDQEFYARNKLGRGLFFSADKFGRDVLASDKINRWGGANLQDDEIGKSIREAVTQYPISAGAQEALINLLLSDKDYLAGRSRAEKITMLRKISYQQFLLKYAGVPLEASDVFRDSIVGLWGVGWDALSALQAYRDGMPGVQHLGLGELEGEPPGRDEPYIFHFPDGNAGVTRLLVRQLIPQAVPGSTMEDVVLARVDYAALDDPASAARIRLNSTAVDVRHATGGREVEITYVRGGRPERVGARHVIMACDNKMIPYLCPEASKAQREALEYATKVPLVYQNIAVRNWKPFKELGYARISIPKADYMNAFTVDFPVSMGGYKFAHDPAQPTVIHGSWVPTEPGKGLVAREQHEAGRRKLYAASFDDFEKDIMAKMDGALGRAGFDAERDIAAITVNRYPHGYAYEYNDFADPRDWGPEKGPHIAGRARICRISIANADASAYAYINGSFDAAIRAVEEQMS
jgi:spermidine dehydrogenase